MLATFGTLHLEKISNKENIHINNFFADIGEFEKHIYIQTYRTTIPPFKRNNYFVHLIYIYRFY